MTKYLRTKFSRKAAYITLLLTLVLVGRIVSEAVGVYYPQLNVKRPEMQKPMSEKTVYLTYDDGPSKNTEKLLDILKEENVPATFFVIGKDGEEYEKLYKRTADEGHTLGLHCYEHNYKKIYKNSDNYLEDFAQIDELIYKTTGARANIMRFPGGSCNSTSSTAAMNEIIAEIINRGYIYYDWNVVSGDDTAVVYAPEVLLENVVRGARDKKSVVVLFHDTDLARTTPEATRLVIEYFKKEGYAFAVLDQSVAPIQFAAWRKK